MSLSARAIAVSGLGFGAVLVAVAGLAPAEHTWDMSQGAAKSAHIKFAPIQDAEARTTELKGAFQTAVLRPRADAFPIVIGESGHASFNAPFVLKADAEYKFRGVEVQASNADIFPEADSNINVTTEANKVEFSSIEPQAGATPLVFEERAWVGTTTVLPKGIKNPTDEELLVMVYTALRKNRV